MAVIVVEWAWSRNKVNLLLMISSLLSNVFCNDIQRNSLLTSLVRNSTPGNINWKSGICLCAWMNCNAWWSSLASSQFVIVLCPRRNFQNDAYVSTVLLYVLPIFYHEKVWSIFSPFLWCLCSQKGKAQQSRRADSSWYYIVFTI